MVSIFNLNSLGPMLHIAQFGDMLAIRASAASVKEPSPISRRFPATFHIRIQDFAPVAETFRYNPAPSEWRPGFK